MAHLLTTVNSQKPDVLGAITSNLTGLQYLCIGNIDAYNFALIGGSYPTYPKSIVAGDEYLWYYGTNYFINTITGSTINNYSTGWAESFTLPAGDYVCMFNVGALGTADGTARGIYCSLTDGTTQLSGTVSSGRENYRVYNNCKIPSNTRFTLSTSTTVSVKIDTEISQAEWAVQHSSIVFIKEG